MDVSVARSKVENKCVKCKLIGCPDRTRPNLSWNAEDIHYDREEVVIVPPRDYSSLCDCDQCEKLSKRFEQIDKCRLEKAKGLQSVNTRTQSSLSVSSLKDYTVYVECFISKRSSIKRRHKKVVRATSEAEAISKIPRYFTNIHKTKISKVKGVLIETETQESQPCRP